MYEGVPVVFINKVENGLNNQVFKGYQHEINDVGEHVRRFNYPYDYKNDTAEIEIYKVEKAPGEYLGLKLGEKLRNIPLTKEGVIINTRNLPELEEGAPFAYKININGNSFADSGIKFSNNATLVSTIGTAPMTHGAGCLSMPDSDCLGAYYDAKGKLQYDPARQKEKEGVTRSFSNVFGGDIAGCEHNLKRMKALGATYAVFLPIVGGDNRSSHHYWGKNNFQIADTLGTAEQYASLVRNAFSKGIVLVQDGIFTSEGLEGIHVQHALRWGEQSPAYYWFKMTGLKNGPLGFGVTPKNYKNLRHLVINPPVVYNEKSKKYEPNLKYNPNKETYFQIYDASQVTEDQVKNPDKPIETYKNIKSDNPLALNTHNDTIIPYAPEITAKEYIDATNRFMEYRKGLSENIEPNSPEGTLVIAQFNNFKLIKKTDGGFSAWDANTDMVKKNYGVSAFDEIQDKSVVNIEERERVRQLRKRGSFEVKDDAIQSARYWTGKVKDIQTLYTAKTLGNISTSKDIQELVKSEQLPQSAVLNEKALKNAYNGFYKRAPKGLLDKDQVTIKSLMRLPLTAIELGENTTSVLATPYFTNSAINDETLGKTRFELAEEGNPQTVEPYKSNYTRFNQLYSNELKDFAYNVIKKVDDTSEEKLLDENGNYTEYGEYVVEIIGQDIAKYAFIKALTGDKIKASKLESGELTFNYRELRNLTTLKTLGINASNPEEEAAKLEKVIEKGLKRLSSTEVNELAESVSERIKGTNVHSFRLAEAMAEKAAKGLAWRLDAAKDVIDWDAVRNGYMTFDEAWDQVIAFWKHFVQAVKKENPNAYIVAEFTDVDMLMKEILGAKADIYANDFSSCSNKYLSAKDAINRFFIETGATTEAGYDYFFTDLLKSFSSDMVDGSGGKSYKISEKIDMLINNRSADYTRNLLTFMDNHDKPSVIHGMALNMGLFFANMETNGYARREAVRVLCDVDRLEDAPQEVQQNIDNPDYFRTVNPKAVAMSILFRDCINENIADENIKKHLKKALVNLTNGNFCGELDGKIETWPGKEPIMYEDPQIAEKKDGYGAKDFETIINMIIKQAEYNAKKDGESFELTQQQKDEILVKLFKASTEPAVQKAVMYFSALCALPGTPTLYMRDALGALGFERKSKNLDLQNRNAIPWSEFEDVNHPLNEYRHKIWDMFSEVMAIRNKEGLEPLNNGTAYKIYTSNNDIPGVLMQDGQGNMTVSVFNHTGVQTGNRDVYDRSLYDKDGNYADSINKDNKYVPVQGPTEISDITLASGVGLAAGASYFVNANPQDTAKYIVQKWNDGLYHIVREGFELVNGVPNLKISLNGITAKNGVMVLKKVAFKGRQINKQYNIVSNPYKIKDEPKEGQNLSIIAK